MDKEFALFERIARNTIRSASPLSIEIKRDHPFEMRNIHPLLPSVVRELFDDGHYAQATFEAFKFVDQEVARLAQQSESGFKLMMQVFAETNPILQLTHCVTTSEKDEQKGFQFLFAGSMLAIRNPRGHQHSVHDSPDECLDHLAIASVLLRRLEAANLKISSPV